MCTNFGSWKNRVETPGRHRWPGAVFMVGHHRLRWSAVSGFVAGRCLGKKNKLFNHKLCVL
jgi:hypothetical protein